MLAHLLPDGRVPVLLSAHDESLISQDARAILDFLDRSGEGNDPTPAVASTLLRLRRVRRHRAVARVADRAELVVTLSALACGDEHPLVARSAKSGGLHIAFVFPGQGNQWPSMGADAYQRLPAYRAEADRCAQAFAEARLPSPLPYLTGEREQNWSRIEIQGAQFVHAVSLAGQWRYHGVLRISRSATVLVRSPPPTWPERRVVRRGRCGRCGSRWSIGCRVATPWRCSVWASPRRSR